MQLITRIVTFSIVATCAAAPSYGESPKPFEPPSLTPAETNQSNQPETVTTFEPKFLPGIKPCEGKQSSNGRLFNNCQDQAVLNSLSTRTPSEQFEQETIVNDEVRPNGNLLRIDIQRRLRFPKPAQTSEQ